MLLVVIFVTLIVYWLYYELHLKRKDFPEGPTPLPLFGNSVNMLVDPEIGAKLLKLKREFGDIFTFWMGTMPFVFCVDHEKQRELFKKDSASGRLDNPIMEVANKGKYGIINTEGEDWKEQRRFALHELRDIGFGRPIIEEKIMKEIEKMIVHIDDISAHSPSGIGVGIKIKYPIQLCVSNIISAVVFNRSFERGDKMLDEMLYITNEGNLRSELATEVFSDPIMGLAMAFPWLRHLPIFQHFGFDLMKEFGDRFHSFVKKVIDEREENKKNSKDPEHFQDLVQGFLDEYYKREETGDVGTFHMRQLRSSIIDVFVAGFETTVTTMRYMFLYLLHHSDIQEKLYAEIEQVVGKDRRVSLADRQNMPFCNAVIAETQRLSSIIPTALPHRALEDIYFDGIKIKAGTLLMCPPIAVHHDPDIFESPMTFYPERFMGEGKTKLDYVRQFGTGKRQCLGESLARAELFLITANIVQIYRIEAVDKLNPPTLEMDKKRSFTPTDYDGMFNKRN